MKIILCYHRISNYYDDFNLMNVSIRNFEMHMCYLKNHFNLVSLEQLTERRNDENDQIAITFDDGYRDVYCHALPILEKYQIPATAFIATENIDTDEENWPDIVMRACLQPALYHDYFDLENELTEMRCHTRNLQERCEFYAVMGDVCARLSARSRKKQIHKLKVWAGIDGAGRESRRILNSEEIQMLADSPLIIIGSHTVTHPLLKYLAMEEQLNEIRDSQNKLEMITGKRINFFAYPYGNRDAFDTTTVSLLKQNGYKLAVTTECNGIDAYTDIFQMPRCVVYNYSGKEFEGFLSGVLKKAKADETEENSFQREMKKNFSLVYVGSLKEDTEVLSGKQKIIIWGYGYWGRELYKELEMLGLGERILAFGDRNAEKFNLANSKTSVLCAEEIAASVKLSETVILIKGTYDWDIFMELKKKGFRNLHIISR